MDKRNTTSKPDGKYQHKCVAIIGQPNVQHSQLIVEMIFNMPTSCLSLLPPKARKTKLASCSSRNVIPDEFEQFRGVFSDILNKVESMPDIIGKAK